MSQYSGRSRHGPRVDHDGHALYDTGTNVSRSSGGAQSSRVSQIKSELASINAELASLRPNTRESTSVVSSVSTATSLRPQDSVSSISTRSGSAPQRSQNSGSGTRSRPTHSSSHGSCNPSEHISIALSHASAGSEGSPSSRYGSRSSQSSVLRSRYQPSVSHVSSTHSQTSQPSLYEGSQSSARDSTISGSRSYYQPSIQRRADGSYYETKIKVSFEVAERSPDTYDCVNDGLRLDENGDYDIEDDVGPYRAHH